MTNFLLEILSEEIPAVMQKTAAENFAKIAWEIFTKNGLELEPSQVKSYITPRRLTLVVSGLHAAQIIPPVKRIGPKIDADKKAIAGFLRSTGLQDESQLEQVENNGARCFAFVSKAQEIKTADIIKNSLPAILQKMTSSWPKLMRWDVAGSAEQPKWIRPVRNILALFGSEIIALEFSGLKSNNQTYGHFLKSSEALTVKDAADYKKILADNFVILDPQERKQTILSSVAKINATLGEVSFF